MKSKLALLGVTALASLLLPACASRYYAREPAWQLQGRGVRPPYSRAVWVPGHWVREHGRSYWRPGYWR
jgi:hypothetical protein